MKSIGISAILLVVVMTLNWLFVKFIVEPYRELIKREYRSLGTIQLRKSRQSNISPHLKLVNTF